MALVLENTPTCVSVVQSTVFESQHDVVLGDALRNVSGVNVGTVNGVNDFCPGYPSVCGDGWVDIDMYGFGPPKYPVGGLRLTPVALPDDDCEVKANGLTGPIQITIHALGTNPVILFQSNLVATHWPVKVSGLLLSTPQSN